MNTFFRIGSMPFAGYQLENSQRNNGGLISWCRGRGVIADKVK